MPLSLAVPNLDLIKRVAEKAREPAGSGRLNGDAEHTRNIRLAAAFQYDTVPRISRPRDYFCPAVIADGKLDCAPK